MDPVDRKRLLAYVSAGMRGASAEARPSSEGVVEVEYAWREGRLGRYVERATPTGERYSLTSMPRGVRAWLAHEHYRDVDMCNSHPSLALQVLRFSLSSRGRGSRPLRGLLCRPPRKAKPWSNRGCAPGPCRGAAQPRCGPMQTRCGPMHSISAP